MFGIVYTVELIVKLVGFKGRFFKAPWPVQSLKMRKVGTKEGKATYIKSSGFSKLKAA